MRKFVMLSLALLCLVGCGGGGTERSSAVVTGTITYKGKPVNGAMLHLHSKKNKDIIFMIPVTQDGTFRVSDVAAGDYQVVVEGSHASEGLPSTKGMDPAKLAEMKEKLAQMKQDAKDTIPFPAKYTQEDTSTLTCSIGKGQQELKLELTD